MSAITWSRRMRSLPPRIWVGRWRLPRCHATRTRCLGSRARISSRGSGADRTSTRRPSSSASASPERSMIASGRSSRNSRPRMPFMAMRRRWRSSKSSTTVSTASSRQEPAAFTSIARMLIALALTCSEQPRAIGRRQVWRKQHDLAFRIGKAEGQNFGHEFANLARRKIDDRRDLLSDQPVS